MVKAAGVVMVIKGAVLVVVVRGAVFLVKAAVFAVPVVVVEAAVDVVGLAIIGTVVIGIAAVTVLLDSLPGVGTSVLPGSGRRCACSCGSDSGCAASHSGSVVPAVVVVLRCQP